MDASHINACFYRDPLSLIHRVECTTECRFSSDVNLDVVDAAGRGFSDAELAVQMAKVGPRSAARRSVDDDDHDAGGAAASESSSAIDLSAAAQCCPIYTVHRDVAFRYRTRRTRRVFSQFSGNIGTVVLAGARHVQTYCDAIDLKCGCRIVPPPLQPCIHFLPSAASFSCCFLYLIFYSPSTPALAVLKILRDGYKNR